MKKLLTIYNIIFILAGNMLFAGLHHIHDHDHDHHHEIEICEECLIISQNKDCEIYTEKVNFLNTSIIENVEQNFTFIEFKIQKQYHNRAPPIS